MTVKITPEKVTEKGDQNLGEKLKNEVLTSGICERKFGITRPTASSDFALLVRLGLAVKQGKGRATRYVLAQSKNR